MKKVIAFLVIVAVLVSCKDAVLKKPSRLIEKDKMIDIMYDLSLLEAIKYQNPISLDTFKINPKVYIYKKYKIDSLQFSKSNTYYASNYEEYSGIVGQVNDRLTKNKIDVNATIKAEEKKKKKKNSVVKTVSPTSKMIDSLEIQQRKRL